MNDTPLIVLCLSRAGVIPGLTGFAFALVASGTLLSVRPPVETRPWYSPAASLAGPLDRSAADMAATALAMIGPGLVGAPIGAYLLHDLDPSVVTLGAGAFLTLYSAGLALLRADFRVGAGNA